MSRSLREFFLNYLKELCIDFVNDLQMTGKQILYQRYIPFLESFRKDRVIRVSESSLYNLPCFIPFQTFLIGQESHHFDDGKGRMSIVQLNGNLIWEF